jgi:hypothetical protein
MIRRRLLIALPLLLLASAAAFAAPVKELRTIKGTWMCPECAALNQADAYETCEAVGHKHALKMDDGEMITFLDTPRAAALIHGGGREKAKIEVCGLYDPSTKILDVDSYRIDNLWTTWCDVHGRMDLCRSTGRPDAPESEHADR